jgi:hypothetical protein
MSADAAPNSPPVIASPAGGVGVGGVGGVGAGGVGVGGAGGVGVGVLTMLPKVAEA